MTILTAVGVISGLGALLGFGLGWVVKKQPETRFGLFILLLSLTFAPFYQSYQVRSQQVRGWYEDVEERLGEEEFGQSKAALQTYQWTSLVGGVVLFLIALSATKVHPILSACLPGVGFVFYFLALLRGLQEDLPRGVTLDNVPAIWLFVWCAGVQIFLLGYVWKGWGYKVNWDEARITRHCS
ncbi:hypothetical protein [Salinibacter altiplanensis]|uniref:hypothetical protein n=1 Tax=Salinibacter altiplanensis TaxID=1803181 RepID=UPI000C9FEEB0|nr:hypothetical protein [Salinibacter altiplanensis]